MKENNNYLSNLIEQYNSYPKFNSNLNEVESAADAIRKRNSREAAGKGLANYFLKLPMQDIENNKQVNTIEKQKQMGDLFKKYQKEKPKQMVALFKAYQNGNTYGNFGRKIDEKNNTKDVLPYVLSKDSRFKYEGQSYLDSDDIAAIAKVSLSSKKLISEVNKGKQIEGISRWDYSISEKQMIEAVETLISMVNIARSQSGQNRSLSSILPDEVSTEVVKGVVSSRVNSAKDFASIAKSQNKSILSSVLGMFSRNNDKVKSNFDNKGNFDNTRY